jgi:NTE family protein
MLGLAVGVVLSGGGARGIAHMGVLKALEEANVPVDFVAGTSMGAIFAAGYARGWNADALMAKVRQLFRRRTALYDPTIPFESLLAGHKLEQVLRGYFEGLDIEGLWLPFFCVSTDLTQAEAHLHDRGELWRAVAASCSIPGIFPPRHEGGRLLVDGGVVDNLPVAHMAERLKGKIVASDVNVFREVTPEPTPRSTISRVLDFIRWINPLSSGGSGPEVFELLLRSSMVGSQHTARTSLERGEVSLYLPLPVERIGLLDWGAHEQLYRVGREFATGRIAAWRPE